MLFGAVLQAAVLERRFKALGANVAPSTPTNSVSAAVVPAVAAGASVLPDTPVNSNSAAVAPLVGAGVNIIPANPANSTSASVTPVVGSSAHVQPTAVFSDSDAQAPTVGAGVNVIVGTTTITSNGGPVLGGPVLGFAVLAGPTVSRSAVLPAQTGSDAQAPMVAAGVNVTNFSPANSNSAAVAPYVDTERRRRTVLIIVS